MHNDGPTPGASTLSEIADWISVLTAVPGLFLAVVGFVIAYKQLRKTRDAAVAAASAASNAAEAATLLTTLVAAGRISRSSALAHAASESNDFSAASRHIHEAHLLLTQLSINQSAEEPVASKVNESLSLADRLQINIIRLSEPSADPALKQKITRSIKRLDILVRGIEAMIELKNQQSTRSKANAGI